MKSFPFTRVLLLPLLALALAACGSDDDDNVSSAPAPAPTTQPSLANWQSVVAMSGCDFNSIRPMDSSRDFAHDLIDNGNGMGAANTGTGPGSVSDASDVTMPGNASDFVSDGSSAMDVAAFQCTGTNARTFTLNRSGQFSFADGQQGQLSQAELDQINQYNANLGNVNITNVNCENNPGVSSNQLIYVAAADAPRTYVFVADDSGNRQCYLGTRDQALGLQQAVQKAMANHTTSGTR